MVVRLPYTLTEKLHEGASTVIYRAVRAADGAAVILKLARGGADLAAGAHASLRRELGLLQAIDHPGVVRALALEPVGGELALVLEDFGGLSLDVLRAGRPLDLATALSIGAQIADALAAVHRVPLVHSDVKPHNIVYDPASGIAKLIDFSIASPASGEPTRADAPPRFQGTLAYTAPEQTGRMNRPVDARSDLYSLGVTLYELLTGALPFASDDPMAVVHGHLARTPTPPAHLAPGLPEVVSDLVMKLLAKAAEDRYQTAAALADDLRRCAEALRDTGHIAPFPLAAGDRPEAPRIPRALYGRRQHLDVLLGAFGRAAVGRAELVLVRGEPGVGKSSLVHALAAPAAERGGFFVTGKCDQVDRGSPYAPIAQALRELCRALLTTHPRALEAWRRDLCAAVGVNGKLLTELLPELELILGPQPDVPELGPTEAQNRFNLVFTSLLRAFATAEHPLVLVLDDLQWADPASLRLLRELLADGERGHMLIVGSYRDGEVGPDHPLLAAVGDPRAAGVEVQTLHLAPLAPDDIAALLADALALPRDDVAPLAAIVADKTRGNPFFIGQFLQTLVADGLLAWDPAARRFRWDDAEVRARDVTDNVVDLVAAKIRRLTPGAQRLLQLAACIGHSFSRRTLEALDPELAASGGDALRELLREGLVLPVTGVRERGDHDLRFLHDRVQQAASSLMSDDDRAATHLRIGRLLRDRDPAGVPDEALFDVVTHLNHALDRIDDPGERLALARLDLRAGRRARAASAHDAARRLFAAGSACLDADAWTREYDLTFALRVELAESTHLSGALAEADALFRDALAHARTRRERAKIHDLRVVLHTAMGDFGAMLAAGAAALSEYDLHLPTEGQPLADAIAAGFLAADENLDDRPIPALLDAPPSEDPDVAVIMRVLASMSGPVFVGRPALFPLIVLHMVNLSLRHGCVPGSDYAYAVYGLMLSGGGDLDRGYAFGELGVELSARMGDPRTRCMVHFLFGTSLIFCRKPYRAGQAYRDAARDEALAVGNFAYVAFYCIQAASLALLADDDLRGAASRFKELADLLARTRDAPSGAVVAFMRRVLDNLVGDAPTSALDGDGFDEAAFVAAIPPDGLVPWLYAVSKLRLTYLYGEHARGLELADRARALHAAGAGRGHVYTTEQHFWSGLTAAALHDGAPPSSRPPHAAPLPERPPHAARLDEDRAALRAWSRSNPAQYLAMQHVLDAEAARLTGSETDAIGLYEQAIGEAQARGLVLIAAVASERAGLLHLRRGRSSLAAAYLDDAHLGYVRWGAAAKARRLSEAHHDLLTAARGSVPPGVSRTATTARTLDAVGLGLEGLLRAARAIVGELVLDRILEQLMRIVMLHAGAQRGFLLVPKGDRFHVAAEMRTAPDELRAGLDAPIDDGAALSASVVRYVARTREALILGDASAEPRFARDPYILARAPRSLLCLPLLHQGRLLGLLYVENNAVRDAFTADRIEVLQLLSAQAAVAIENAHLYAAAEQARADLARANEALELEVRARTRDLEDALDRLRDANADLVRRGDELRREMDERARAERERTEIQGEMLRVHEERLADMAAPLIPITDHVVVMPLIGTMDDARAAQVLEAALGGAAERHAEVVILDVTGLRQFDRGAASMLVRTASALRLVGAHAVLTGLRPAMARSLVESEADLAGLVTLGSLQNGIAYALGRTRKGARAG